MANSNYKINFSKIFSQADRKHHRSRRDDLCFLRKYIRFNVTKNKPDMFGIRVWL